MTHACRVRLSTAVALTIALAATWSGPFGTSLTRADAPEPSASSALTPPWAHRDIGAVAVPGSAQVSDGNFTIAGTLDIWAKADGFHFVYQSLDGDGEINARVNAVENTNNHAKSGVMIRDSIEPGAKHATMVVTAVDGTQFLRRNETDGITTATRTGRDRGKFPFWVKLVRKGDLFSAYESADGIEWFKVGEDKVPMGQHVLIGLVGSSHQKTVTSTSRIDRVKVEPVQR